MDSDGGFHRKHSVSYTTGDTRIDQLQKFVMSL